MPQTISGPKLDRSQITPVTTREELIYLLTRAAELEHGLACIYLFAAYSLKNDVSEGGMTGEQAEMVRAVSRRTNRSAAGCTGISTSTMRRTEESAGFRLSVAFE